MPVYVNTAARSGMKAQLALCMKYMPAACMKSLTLTHEGLEFGFAKFQFIASYNQSPGARADRAGQETFYARH